MSTENNSNNFHLDKAHPTPADDDINCAERWKNAGPEHRKGMFALFEETGIFVAVCRHRTILYACDMMKSGELFVIPLYIKMLANVFKTELNTP